MQPSRQEYWHLKNWLKTSARKRTEAIRSINKREKTNERIRTKKKKQVREEELKKKKDIKAKLQNDKRS